MWGLLVNYAGLELIQVTVILRSQNYENRDYIAKYFMTIVKYQRSKIGPQQHSTLI